MDASVIICTRNRAASLARTLASIEAADRPAGCVWELVVVDNGSTDETGSVLAGFSGRLPLVAVSEPNPGISHARNRGVATAAGRYFIGTDDDVVVERGWLAAYLDAFRHWPEAVLFGGKVVPTLEEPVTPWFAACLAELALLVAERDFGADPLPLASEGDRVPFGANFAIRAAEQVRFPFDPALGRAPERNVLGEETEVFHAVLAAGHSGYYVPGAVVRHMIPPHRQRGSYVRSYYGAHGDQSGLADPNDYRRVVAGAPLWLWRQLATETAAVAWGRLFASPHVWVPHLKRLGYMEGYGEGLRRRRRRARGLTTA
jgi:glycosyltransferase involved in cell wall biosynthesis